MSRSKTWLADLEAAIIPLLESEGYELVLLEHIPRGRMLRLYIDRAVDAGVEGGAAEGGAEGDAGARVGVGIDDCSHVSRVVSDLLDAEGFSDRIEGHYTLEVSSPGLDRPLTKAKDFKRYVGREVQLATHALHEGRKRFRGVLVGADDHEVRLHVDGKSYVLPYAAIERARLVPEF